MRFPLQIRGNCSWRCPDRSTGLGYPTRLSLRSYHRRNRRTWHLDLVLSVHGARCRNVADIGILRYRAMLDIEPYQYLELSRRSATLRVEELQRLLRRICAVAVELDAVCPVRGIGYGRVLVHDDLHRGAIPVWRVHRLVCKYSRTARAVSGSITGLN